MRTIKDGTTLHSPPPPQNQISNKKATTTEHENKIKMFRRTTKCNIIVMFLRVQQYPNELGTSGIRHYEMQL